MAHEQKHAIMLCVIFTILALIGIACGIYWKVPIAIVGAMLPAVIYEVYRTEGFFTKIASIGMLAVLIAEAVLIIGGINLNLAGIAGRTAITFRTFRIPLGDVKIVGPIIIAALSVILMRRTAGKYTIWLAGVILISSLALLYALNANIISGLPGGGVVEEGLKRIIK